MTHKIKIAKVNGKVQNYQWGGFKYIADLLKIPNTEQQPMAEYWLGAHDNAPSLVNEQPLNQLLQQQPALLGKEVSSSFGRLPFLLKILDVKDMLSIQVHPSKKAAEKGYAAENASGVAANAGTRNYKDDNHKPELMAALGDFWLLHGFRNPADMQRVIEGVPEFSFMLPLLKKGGIRLLYERVMTMPQKDVDHILLPLIHRITPLYDSNVIGKDQPDFWAARAARMFQHPRGVDRGIFSVYLLNLVHIPAGSAIFQDAGILHAYLEGQNVEIMANSDNVLRGGLTPKHIDVAELMKHVSFEPVEPHVQQATRLSEFEAAFKTPAADFQLNHLLIPAGRSIKLESATTEIFILLKGLVKVRDAETDLTCTAGETFISWAGSSLTLEAIETTEIYKATTPIDAF